jgi:hypothetical protein
MARLWRATRIEHVGIAEQAGTNEVGRFCVWPLRSGRPPRGSKDSARFLRRRRREVLACWGRMLG